MKRPSCIFKLASRFAGAFILFLCIIYLIKFTLPSKRCDGKYVHPDQIQQTQYYVKQVLKGECRKSFVKWEMNRLFNQRYSTGLPIFMHESLSLNQSIFKYSPPFGFHKYMGDLLDVLKLMPDQDLPEEFKSQQCKRCIVIGNGGILRGLRIGHTVDQYDIVIRLNSAPVHGYSNDVGNKTTIRMTYPEGAPILEQEYRHSGLLVAVLFKSVDFRWLQAMLKNESLSIWNKMFFWKQVAENIPVTSKQFRILNPLIIKETAMDILQYPEPQDKWWGWDKNLPTMGVTAIILATHLCDEVSIAGFGYDLNQPVAHLHYYEDLCMAEMNQQNMHDISEETKLLQKLVKEGVVQDVTGGIDCKFCHHTSS